MPVLVRKNINVRKVSLLTLMTSTDFATKTKMQADILGIIVDMGLLIYRELTGPEKDKSLVMEDDDLERLVLRAAKRLQDKRNK